MKRLAILAMGLTGALWGQYPPQVQWQRIRTSHFDVIFPREVTADAQRLANALETLYQPLSQSLGASLPRHSTVLLADQNVTRLSGGRVDLFPRMAVMQSMPSQSFWGTNDWIATLTVEEGRRLVQIAKMNHGYGRLMYAFFGESGLAAVMGWSLPDWWVAGDSRAAQTSMLRGGVGQYASSEMATRAVLMSGENYSFMKAMHGSLNDAVPSQAELGSLMVENVEHATSADMWNQIMERAAQNSWNPFSVSMAMKKETGRSAEQTFNDTMSLLGERWKAAAANTSFSEPEIVNTAPKSSFTGYYQPIFLKDGSVVAQKSGLDTYPMQVVRLAPDGQEKPLFHFAPTVSTANRTSVVDGKIVWDEYVPDIRWLRGYSEIMIRDIASGHTRRLTHHTRFMNPVLSPDGKRVAVVEFLPQHRTSLVILDSGSGAELRRLPSPDNDMIFTPAWAEDGSRLAMVTQASNGRALTMVDLPSGQFRDVIPHRDEELANPVFYRGYILYKSSRDGMVNIFAVETATGQCYRVTASRYGADYPSISPDGTKLLYSDYTARGYNVAELPLDPSRWIKVDTVSPSSTANRGSVHDYSSEIPSTQFTVERYRPGLHPFDVHSWGPDVALPDVGVSMYSNDKMGLFGLQASGFYDTDEHAPGVSTSFQYNGLFPVLDVGVTDRERRIQYVNHYDDFSEHTAAAGFYVPLNLSRGYYNSDITIGANVENVGLQGGRLVPLNYSVGIRHIRQRAPRDLAPGWSQILRFGYSQTVRADHYTANRLYADGRLSLPALFRHHALVVDAGHERNDGNYLFPRQVSFPRGYTPLSVTEITRFSGTYSVPLFYPDWSLGQLLFVKRLSADTFYDHAQASDYGSPVERLYRSTGVEMIFDLNVFHWPGFRLGLREAYRIDYRDKRLQPFLAYGW
jgi:Tol biopolymer transport system component